MKSLGLVDVETSGIDHTKDQLLEVGLVVWSVTHRSVFEARSWLITATKNEAEAVNGIPVGMCKLAYARETVKNHLALYPVDAWVSWSMFDRDWLPELHGDPWIDAMDDFIWPRASSGKKLVEVALAHGVGVVDAHRALTDCLTMARLLERVGELLDNGGESLESFEDWIAQAMRPRATFKALVSYADKDEAKSLGFRWNDEKHPKWPKTWTKRLAIDDVAQLPFRVERVS